MSLPFDPSDIKAKCRNLRRLGHSLASLASHLGIEPEALGTLLGEPAWKEIPPDPETTNDDDSEPGPQPRHA